MKKKKQKQKQMMSKILKEVEPPQIIEQNPTILQMFNMK